MVGTDTMDRRRARKALGLRGKASPDGLRRAFRAAVKTAHPDHGGDPARLREVVAAYHFLRGEPEPAPLPVPAPGPEAMVLTITPLQALTGGPAETVLPDGRRLRIMTPAGLRPGETVRAGETMLTVRVSTDAELAVRGDDLWLAADLPLDAPRGGRMGVQTPSGPRLVWVDRQALARGHVRLSGLGLPARGPHAAGDLFVTVRTQDRPESASRTRLRAFAEAWAPAAL